MSTIEEKPPIPAVSRDPATNTMVDIARSEGVATVWDRYKGQQPQCKFGMTGVCCRLCHMGPCRITPKADKGICGADVDTIVARNLLREIARRDGRTRRPWTHAGKNAAARRERAGGRV